ncbi:MAG: hypothetical protein ACE15C_11650 [Phycisphaerae bacterium]
MRQWLMPALMGFGLLCGCEPPVDKMTATPPRPVTGVEQMAILIQPPTAVSWTDRAAPDGIIVGVYFFAPGRPLATPVAGGVDVLLFEGAAPADPEKDKPFFTWSFTQEQLKSLLARTPYGWAYAMRLGWGDRVPTSDKITVLGRYKPPGERPIYSKPVTIPMAAK